MKKLYKVKAQCVFDTNMKPMINAPRPEYYIIAESHGIAARKAMDKFESENLGLTLVELNNLDVDLIAKESTNNTYPQLIICE